MQLLPFQHVLHDKAQQFSKDQRPQPSHKHSSIYYMKGWWKPMCKTSWLKAKHELNLKSWLPHTNVFLKNISYRLGTNLVSKENSF